MPPAAIPARPCLARASLTGTDTSATISLYADNPYASVVNDSFTGARYNVETHERELVSLETGEDDRIIDKIVLRVGQPDSFDLVVEKPQNSPISTFYVAAQVSRSHNALMSTYPFLHRRYYIRWSIFPFSCLIR